MFLDITATSDGRATTIDMASHASEDAFNSLCGGRWLPRSCRHACHGVAAGADKVSLNSAAVRDPSLITAAASAFGSQAVVCAIDAKRVGKPGAPGADKWEVFTAGGRNATGLDAVEWAAQLLNVERRDSAHEHGSRRVPRPVSM